MNEKFEKYIGKYVCLYFSPDSPVKTIMGKLLHIKKDKIIIGNSPIYSPPELYWYIEGCEENSFSLPLKQVVDIKSIISIEDITEKIKGVTEARKINIDNLSIIKLDRLMKKHQKTHPKPSIIGEDSVPFLAGLPETWMSVGDTVGGTTEGKERSDGKEKK